MLDEVVEDKKCTNKDCICELLLDILRQQNKIEDCTGRCSLKESQAKHREIIPFILQTPYGYPYFTWGKIGTKDCFVTVFFQVVKVNCEKNCAVLQLLKPNKSIINPETECVETTNICEVDYVTATKERVLVDLNCYHADRKSVV